MLVLMNNTQLLNNHDLIRQTLYNAVPHADGMKPTRFMDMFDKALLGMCQIWNAIEESTGDTYGVAATEVVEDLYTGARSLLVYAFEMRKTVPVEQFNRDLETLKIFGKAQECKSMTAFCENETVARAYTRMVGEDSHYKFYVHTKL